jgi:hypothetical protein
MKLTAIKVGKWYETTLGIGQCVKVGGTFPPGVRIRIERPFPRGELNLTSRDVSREAAPPLTPKQ